MLAAFQHLLLQQGDEVAVVQLWGESVADRAGEQKFGQARSLHIQTNNEDFRQYFFAQTKHRMANK